MRSSGYDRVADDWYVEPASCVDSLIAAEPFDNMTIYDPACGGGNIPRRFAAAGFPVWASDLRDRGFGDVGVDFLASTDSAEGTAIVSTPPYGILEGFVRHGLKLGARKVVVLARLAFLEGQRRAAFFRDCPLARVWVSRPRISMSPGGTDIKASGGSIAYAWFVFDPTHRGAFAGGWLP